MSTTELRPPVAFSSTSAPDLMGDLRYAQTVAANQVTIRLATTEAEERHRRLMHELAALSFDSDSLDRESDFDIWGFHDAE